MGYHDIALRYIGDCVTRHTQVPLRRCQSIINVIVHLLSVLHLFSLVWALIMGNCKSWNAEWNGGTLNGIRNGIWNGMEWNGKIVKNNIMIKACCSILYIYVVSRLFLRTLPSYTEQTKKRD